MTQKTKHIGLLLLVGALLSIILLTTSLSDLELQPGNPFPGAGNSGSIKDPISSSPAQDTLSIPVARGLIALLFLVLLIYVPARMIVFVNFKKLFQFILIMVVLLGLVTLIPKITSNPTTSTSTQSTQVPPPPPDTYPVSPIGQPPQALIQIVILIAVVGIGFLTFMIMRRTINSTNVEDQLLKEAEDAVNALKDGGEFKNVIIRCYLQMTYALQQKQDIERNEQMTVREFEELLEHRGFPANPVHQLTSLFEKVRYGQQHISQTDETQAINSLNEIIQFCQNRGS